MLDALREVAGWVKKNFWAKTDNIILRAGQYVRVGNSQLKDDKLGIGTLDVSGNATFSGRVGIGTTATPTRLMVYGDDAEATHPGSAVNAAIRIAKGGLSAFGERAEVQFAIGGASYSPSAAVSAVYTHWASGANPMGTDLRFATAPTNGTLTDRMSITRNGDVGIGTDVPLGKLDISGVADATKLYFVPDRATGAMDIISRKNNSSSAQPGRDIRFLTQWNEGLSVIIKADGNVGIGTTAPSYKLDVSGDINASGSVRSNGTPLTSDGTLKDAPTPTKDALSKLAAVRGYEFAWSDKARQMGLPDGVQHGLIAQEVEQIFPDLVSEWEVETGEFVEGENGERTPMKERIKCVDYARMVPILLEAVRELAGRVDALSRSSRSPQSAQSP
jgi:hypothetical protein